MTSSLAAASIFTFPHDADGGVTSPWEADALATETGTARRGRLPPEPQTGAVEYKLHLLLRPRRRFTYTSTSTAGVDGASNSNGSSGRRDSRRECTAAATAGTGVAAPTYREVRLERLTTQLLWRLQQSATGRAEGGFDSVVSPQSGAGGTETLKAQETSLSHARLGTENSHGALYEIGVADDGLLVGLAEDEMRESLDTLREMAASVGCLVREQRRVVVGECAWVDDDDDDNDNNKQNRQVGGGGRGELLVVEALVSPDPGVSARGMRVHLTGAVGAGQSTLLRALTSFACTGDGGGGGGALYGRARQVVYTNSAVDGAHRTLLCIAADADADDDELEQSLDLDSNLALIIAVTKVDAVSRAGLRLTLGRLLSALKKSGKKPALLSNGFNRPMEGGLDGSWEQQEAEGKEGDVCRQTRLAVESIVYSSSSSDDGDTVCVPIVMTSAVLGSGIRVLHDLLHALANARE